MLTIPNASCVIVGDTNVPTLTNKTLTDSIKKYDAKIIKKQNNNN